MPETSDIQKRIDRTLGVSAAQEASNPFPQEPKDIIHRILEVAEESANILCAPQLQRSAPHLYKLGMQLRKQEQEIYYEYWHNHMDVVEQRVQSPQFKDLLHEAAYVFDALQFNETLKKALNTKLKIMTRPPEPLVTQRSKGGPPCDHVGEVFKKYNKIMSQELKGARPQIFTSDEPQKKYPQADANLKLLTNLVTSSHRAM